MTFVEALISRALWASLDGQSLSMTGPLSYVHGTMAHIRRLLR